MGTSSILLLCIVVTCSVWTVKGRSFEIDIDDQPVDVEISAGFQGKCWACKWALNKVKRVIGKNTTAETVKSKLNAVCNEIGLLKSICRKFVKTHLAELIEELTTTDDVKTICVNTGACSPKEVAHLLFRPKHEESQTEIIEYP